MKAHLTLLTLLFCQWAHAVPHEPFDVEEFTGEVEFAVWRSGIVLERVFATPKGEAQNKTRDSLPDHWIIMLRNVKGLTEKQRNSISFAFAVTPKLPIDWSRKRYLRVQDENYIYLRINGDKDWPIQLGSTMKIEKLRYWGLDFSGFILLDGVLVDGKRVELPITPQNRKYKGVEQDPSEKPATASKSKPEGKKKPKPESEGG